MRLALLLLVACGGETMPIDPTDPGPADVTIAVRSDRGRRPISPLIYGVNGDARVDAQSLRPGIIRSGGNRLTAYNWENNASNAGSDYCFQNDGLLGGPGTMPVNAFREILDDADDRGSAALLTVPIVDHVAADHDDMGDGGAGPPACVGDVRKSGVDYLTTRFRQNHAKKGAAFAASPDVNDTHVYQDEMVAYLKSHWSQTRVVFSLDNEPDLWSETHEEIHPAKVTYAELVARNEQYAKAVKDVWPDAEVAGFVSYGFNGYVTLQDAPDADGDFIDFYLDAMKAAHDRAGKRLVDYLDLHWYPEATGDGVRITERFDATGAAARVQAPRSLWDPTYREQSWIADDYLGAPIALLPRLEAQIAAHYPGTRLAFTEWNYGGGDHISGALATADVLGIFGKYGVGMATLWFLHVGDFPPTDHERFTRAGLAVYTSYDGAGARFGATSIEAETSDTSTLSAYASDGDRIVVVIINKASNARTAALTIADPRRFTAADLWVLAGTDPTIRPATSLQATSVQGFLIPLPASSITVVVPR